MAEIKRRYSPQQKTTLEFPVIKKYYYVVDFRDFLNPKLLPLYFLSKKYAKRGIKKNIERNKRKFYSVLKGSELLKGTFPYILSEGKWGNITKYVYPENRITRQQKKTYRTIMRRRLRRMGLLTLVKPKKSFDEKPDYIKLVKNHQWIATNKYTIAKAFQVDRKPSKYIYVIIKRLEPKHRSYLATLKVVRIDLEAGDYSYRKLHLLKTDILTPLILTEVYERIEKLSICKKIIKFCRKKGVEGFQG